MKISDKKIAIIVFVIFAILSIVFSYFIMKIQMKGTESLIPPNDPSVIAMEKMNKEFGSSKQIMLIFKTDGIFKPKTSKALYELTGFLKKIDGVVNVQSIFDAASVKFTLVGLKTTPYFKDGLPTPQATQMLKSNLYVGNLVDPSGKITSMILTVSKDSKGVVDSVKTLLRKEAPHSMKYYITGEDVVDSAMNSSVIILSLFYPPLLFGLMWLLYFLKLGNVIAAAIPPLLAILAAMWTYGAAGMVGFPLNILTSTVGIFVIVVSSSYGLHFLDRYMFNRSTTDHHNAVIKTMKEEGIPIAMSALTTMVGFITFVFTGINAFKTFGILVSIGVGISALFAIVLIPAITKFFDLHKRVIPTLKFKIVPSSKFNKIAMLLILALIALSPIFISRINVNSDEFGYFKSNSDVRSSARVAGEYFGWVLPVYVMVEKSEPFTTADVARLEEFISRIKKIPGVSGVNSIFDISKSFNVPLPMLQALSRNPSYSSYFLEWFSGNTTRLLVKTPRTDTNSAQKIAQDLETLAKEFPQYNISIASPALTYGAMNSSIMKNQISTIFMAFFFILGLLILTFRSFMPPLIATVPIVLTVVLNFALMGAMRVNLEISTAIVSSILMGLVIDYSIHTISRYRMSKNIDGTITEVGPVIVDNAFGLMAGFATLVFSPLLLYVKLGALLSMGIGIGAFTTLIFVTELLRMYDKRKKAVSKRASKKRSSKN